MASREQEPKSSKQIGLAERTKEYKKVHKQTHNPRAAVRAYCSGNKWATENAKAVGNW